MTKLFKTEKEIIKYLTIDNYFTPREIEYRKNIIIQNGFEYEKIYKKILEYRKKYSKKLLLLEEEQFYFVETHKIKEDIEKLKKFWKSMSYIFKDKYKQELILDTLISEAFSSSSIEGAHSTKKRTEEIIKKNLSPEDKSEKMILNNYKALEYIFSLEEKRKIDEELVLKLHKIITQETLDNKDDEGIFRDDSVDIISSTQKVIFSPTSNIKKMYRMIKTLFNFINNKDIDYDNDYIEDIYKIIAFHFLYSYIHPHFDGNGRTIRVLFTYLLAKNGFDMFYYISLSEIIHSSERKKREYEKAFLKVEHNQLDLTYFIYYMLDIMKEALKLLEDRIYLYFREDIILNKVKKLGIALTQRQKTILQIIARNKTQYSMTSLEISNRLKISKQTILKDIKLLIDFKLLKKIKIGRKIYYQLYIEEVKA